VTDDRTSIAALPALRAATRCVEGFLDTWDRTFPGDDALLKALEALIARRRGENNVTPETE
jgi:hypothetical protein